MQNEKKFFWLKLKNNFFDREEIKLIEATQNGKDYIIFYMKLLLKSIENEGKLYFRNTIPYSPEMLATITNTNIDTVKVAVEMFLRLGLMEKWDDGTFFMIETQNMIGTETKWAQYKRESKKAKVSIGNFPILSNEIPIEINQDLEQNINYSLFLSQNNKPKSNDCKRFKQKLINLNPNFYFSLSGKLGYSNDHMGFCLKNGYLYSLHTHKLLESKESLEIWQYLCSVGDIALQAAKKQLNETQGE